MKGAAQDMAEDVAQDLAQDLAFGAWAARALLATPPPPPPPSLRSSRWDRGATGQLSGMWLGLWASTSGGAAQSVYMFIMSCSKSRQVTARNPLRAAPAQL